MKKHSYLKFFLYLTFIFILYSFSKDDGAQRVISFRNPLDNSVSLSGSYGELRATHFHSGIDLRVGGVTGAPIHAAADGYISRISISPTGYGNALYISHPNGKTTLYGHMLDFSPSITAWVREQQYKKESFRVNLTPESSRFKVKKGDVLGRAGNSGSSGGPHLHFEVRETESQLPLNPLYYSQINVVDNISPQFQKVNFYSISNYETIAKRELIRSFKGGYSHVFEVSDTFYVAVAGIDKQNNTYSKLAVYRYNYYLDNQLVFSFTPEGVPFNKGRYINSVVEFPEKQSSNLSLIKSWVEPGCGITSNIKAINNGLFILEDNLIHEVKIELIDEHLNSSTRLYKVRRAKSKQVIIAGAQNSEDSLRDKGVVMPWFLPNRYENEFLRILLPPGALYSSINFNCDTVNYDDQLFIDVHDIGTPLHNSARMAIKAKVPEHLQDKALIVKRDKNGKLSSVGGRYNNGWVESSIRSFGRYGIAYDTIMPVVTPNFRKGENISGRRNLRFTIYDNLSGISSYRVHIDGKWVLTSYDPKKKRLQTELKRDVIKKGGKHIITIFVTDNKDNTNLIKSSFIW